MTKRKNSFITRFFTKEGVHPYDEVNWVKRNAEIPGSGFKMENVEFPDFYSQNAVNIIASKYFKVNRGKQETSLKELIDRVVKTFKKWGLEQGYFDEKEAEIYEKELTYIILHQYATFNSPVWFNIGVEGRSQQASACFILDVEDNMESILDWIKIEGLIFKGGSGSGVNLSKLRGKGEKLSTGGASSGVISFMRAADAVAGSIKSGGSTRRAAKMVILNADHPEIMDFIRVKAEEENKVRALMEAGYDMTDMNNPLWQNIFFQNANNSVRIPDALMEAAMKDGEWKTYYRTTGEVANVYKAKDILWEIAKAAWECGDPGVQFDDIIQKWHTCKNSGKIEATNPCSEYIFLNWTSCNLASINLLKFLKEDGSFDVPAFIHTARVMFLSQDLLISKADYPHPKIAEETKKYRTIGLGYTNLGALIMALGLPYDSDEARDLAASITALMTGTAYKLSAEISSKLGPFPEYERNKEPMMEVMKMHKDHLKYVKENEFNKEILEKAKEVWDEVIELGEKYGFRNAQATVIAPTGCLVGESLISTERGLVPIQTLGNPLGVKWQNLNIEVMTDEGPQLASQFYVNGLAETRRIRTKNGYEIIGTPEHRIKVFDKETGTLKWKYFADIKDGDIVALEMNTIFGSPQPVKLPPLPELYWTSDFETKVPEFMNEELAEIVGYFMGDGSLHSKGLRFCVYKEDKDVIERLKTILQNQFNLKADITPKRGYIEVSVNSVPLTLWWQACGFSKIKRKEGKGWKPHIPLAILYSNDRKIYSAFLRGLFEADGTVWKDSKTPAFCTHDKDFHDQVKYLLLALGYPTKSKIGVSGWGRNNLYVLYIKNRDYAKKFREEIGFIGERKNKLIENIIVKKSQVKMDQIYLSESIIQELLPVLSKREKDSLRLEFRRKGAITRSFALRILEKTKNNLLEFYTQKIFFDKVVLNESAGERLTYDLSVPSNVTYIANGFISHNTISFMMDADTTGIEPDFALVKMKQLVGGGYMKIVNKTVPLALKRLGYTEEQIKDIVKHLEETQNIETAPHIKEEHLPVFDCAIKPPGGKRYIHWMGHVKMVAAVQPFISGGISKTFNMPNETTIQEIYDAYFTAWKLGIKCFAVYRDGSKATQALYVSKQEKKQKETFTRKRLPDIRPSETHKFSIAGHEGYLTYSTFEDGSLGEIFIRMSKQGSTLAGLLDAFAISISIALQYGVPLKELASKFINMRFEPMGLTNNEKIKTATSIVDYIFKYLAYRFLSKEDLEELGLMTEEEKDKLILKEHPTLFEKKNNPTSNHLKDISGPPCVHCGGITIKTGSCYTCISCGETTSCG
ncbi:MAG: adenosylcobalamin-dependent ribonucleoside-diphosphate reductase [Candidatus Pacebacteria bacterium]|nr:adenosylcobalamin-dependent ribonucleoside-diphosphate reductase [Candidatus Paceibacterota bacterium]